MSFVLLGVWSIATVAYAGGSVIWFVRTPMTTKFRIVAVAASLLTAIVSLPAAERGLVMHGLPIYLVLVAIPMFAAARVMWNRGP